VYPKLDINEPVVAQHQKIIDDSTLYKIFARLGMKEALREEAKGARKHEKEFPFRRVLKCPECGKYLC